MEPAEISPVASGSEGTVVFAPEVLEFQQTAGRLYKSLDEYQALRKALFSLLAETKTDTGRPWRISYSRDPCKGDRTVPVKTRYHTTTGAIVIGGQTLNGIAKIEEPETYAPFHDLKFFDSDNNPPATESLIAANQRKMVLVLTDLLACVKTIARGLPELQREARKLRLTTKTENLAQLDESLPVFPYWPDNMRQMTPEDLGKVFEAESSLVKDARLTLKQLEREAEHLVSGLLGTTSNLAAQLDVLADGLERGTIKADYGPALTGYIIAEAGRLGALNAELLIPLRNEISPIEEALALANAAADWLMRAGLMPSPSETLEGSIRAMAAAFSVAAFLQKGRSVSPSYYLEDIARDDLDQIATLAMAMVTGIRRHVTNIGNECECAGPAKHELTATALELERALNPDQLGFEDPRRRAILPKHWPVSVWTDLRDIRVHFDDVMRACKWEDLCVGPNKRRAYEPIPLSGSYIWPEQKIDDADLKKVELAAERLTKQLRHQDAPRDPRAKERTLSQQTKKLKPLINRPRKASASDRDVITALARATPALDKNGGTWVRNTVAAKLEGIETRTLASYRQLGICDEEGTVGRDRDGRTWRREGTPGSHPWYLKSTLKAK